MAALHGISPTDWPSLAGPAHPTGRRIDQVPTLSGVDAGVLAENCVTAPIQHGLVIGYGVVEPDRIEEGMRRLADAFRQVTS
jgi:DNA-binding transcriptional MocR family regulator